MHGGARMKTLSTVLGAPLAAALVVACASHAAQSNPNTAQSPAPSAEPPPGVTAAQNGFDQKTIDLIADARCDRAEMCNEIGPGRKYATRAECDQLSGSGTSDELNATSCPRGIDESAVSQCVTAIDQQRCSTPLETLSRLANCRTDALCVK